MADQGRGLSREEQIQALTQGADERRKQPAVDDDLAVLAERASGRTPSPEEVVAEAFYAAFGDDESPFYEWPCEDDGYYAPSVHTVAAQAVMALRAAGMLTAPARTQP